MANTRHPCGCVSEPLGELHDDMRWWFSASNHHVQIVLLAKFDENRGALTLEKWEEDAGGQPALRQNIIITQDTTTDPASYNVAGGELVSGFRLLFIRGPRPGEGDFDLSQELKSCAERVWSQV